MIKSMLGAASLLAISLAAGAASPTSDLNDLHQRQFRYARAMMQLNQLEGFEHGPSINGLLDLERDAKAKRAGERWHDPADMRAQSIDAFAKAVEHVATSQRAKRTMSRQWQIDEPYPSHWSVSGNEAAAADCARAIEHPLGQPLRIEMNRDGVAWLRVVAPGKGYWAFDTLVSEFDTKLSVYRDCRDIGSEAKQVSDDTVGLGSIVGLNADAAGQTFLIKLERKGGVGSLAIAKSVLAQSISGTVRRAVDNALVSYGHVTAFRSDGSYTYSDDYIGSNGQFTIPIYDLGSYYVRATEISPNVTSVPEIYPSAVCASVYSMAQTFCSGTMSIVTVSDGQAVSGIDFMLDLATMLSGVVTDASTGEPVPDADVRIFASDDVGEYETRRTLYTDNFGRFRISSLPAGAWRAEFNHSRYALERWNGFKCSGASCPQGSGDTFTTTPQNATVLDPKLTPRNYLRFRVMVGSEAAEIASVTLFNQNGVVVAGGTTGQEPGFVDAGPLAPGSYRAAVSSNTGFTQMFGGPQCAHDCYDERFAGTLIDVPTTPGRIDVNLQEKPSLTVQVVRHNGGAPIAGAMVVLLGNGTYGNYGYSDSAGLVRIPNVDSGTYFVHVIANGFVDELFDDIACEDPDPLVNCAVATPMVFSNASPLERTISVALSPSAVMTGRFSSRDPVSQQVIGSATLYRLGSDGATLSSHSVYSDSGNYSLTDVPAQSQRWGISTYVYFPQIFDGVDCYSNTNYVNFQNCPYASGTLVTNANGTTRSGVDFRLMPKQARIVRVLDATSNAPLQGVVIDQWSPDKVWQASYVTGLDGLAYVRSRGVAVNSIYASYVSTDNFSEYLNEVYDNIACVGGASAYLGNCSMQLAALVPISDTSGAHFAPLEIKLLRDLVFRANFDE